jgi:hypothetical protein
MRLRQPLLSATLIVGCLFPAVASPADRLILRNLDILTDRTVTALDDDGLMLDGPRPGGGDRITWDEVERGRVALDQLRFDKLLADLGPPLYRIRQRLKIGDYEAEGEPAESLYPRFADSKSQTAYLVCQATMWSRLARGKREAAVEPYLRCSELLRSGMASAKSLVGSRQLQTDATTAMSPELVPIWFDAVAAKAALPSVQQAIRSTAQPRPAGAYVYYATLAIAAGAVGEAERVLPLLTGEQGDIPTWRDIVLAEAELAADMAGPAVERLKAERDALPEACRPAALFVLGEADAQSTDEETCRDGLLELLTLPAVYGVQQPELAAAGLYRAVQALDKLKDGTGAAAVRRELASRYAGTHFGAKSRDESKH